MATEMKTIRSGTTSLDALASSCREILNAEPSLERLAIPRLHLRNAHPSSLQQYISILACKAPGLSERIAAFCKREAMRLACVVSREAEWSGDPLPVQADTLFISHFVERQQAAHGRDLYYGNLPVNLAAAGQRVAVAYLNHTQHRWKALKADWAAQPVPRILLGRTCNPKRDLEIIRALTKAGDRLEQSAWDSPLTTALSRWAALDAQMPSAFASLRIGLQIADLIQQLKPKWVVTTFEGHAWERMVFRAVHDAVPPVQCIGYHHTILFPGAYALGAALGHGFDPDVILTAGEISAEWFKTQPLGLSREVRVAGSVRAPTFQPEASPSSSATDCLVVPEGIAAEAAILFGIAIKAARQLPNVRFRLRLHPVLTRQAVLAESPDLGDIPTNAIWSDCELEDDVLASRTVLYRGSTAALTAALAGVRPIYATQEDDLVSIDPLEAIDGWRREICTGSDLATLLSQDLELNQTERDKLRADAQRYCQRYFKPFDRGVFEEIMSNHAVAATTP